MERLMKAEEAEKDEYNTELEQTTNDDKAPLQEQSSFSSWFRSEYLANFGVQYNFNIMRC
jgi:hypothetical protein